MTPPSPQRGWATSSLIAGIIWVVLAVSPTFLTTLLGLPFAGYALAAGWRSRRRSLQAGDKIGARRAVWGMGLGCAGFVYLSAFYVIVGGVLVASLIAWMNAAFSATPTP